MKGILVKSRFIFILVLFTLAFFPLIPLHSQVPPPPPPPSLTEAHPAAEPAEEVSVRRGFTALFYEIQMKGSAYIKHQMEILREGFHLRTFLVITFFSMAYGILHTLGPGHGKLIVMSYFMREGTTKADALSLPVIVSVIHSSGAIILALLFQTLLHSVKGVQKIRLQHGITFFSGLLILTAGILYLIRYLRKQDHGHKAPELAPAAPRSRSRKWKENLFIGYSIGVVPCPLSLTIVMVSIMYGIFWIGITSVISLTFAMTMVLYLIALYTLKSRDFLEHRSRLSRKAGFSRGLIKGLNYTGSVLLILFGCYFMYSTGKVLF